MNQNDAISRSLSFLHIELGKEKAFLLPLRLFLGLGWARTGVVKLLEPGWFSGEALTEILNGQITSNEVYFPFYEALINSVFIPNIVALSWIIFIGEMLVGFALVTGTFTNAALLGGLFMNLNFVLAGWVNPSAFYIVIQVVLFAGGAGSILGIDQLLSKRVKSVFLTSQRRLQLSLIEQRTFLLLTGVFLLLGVSCLPYARDYGPNSVDDPAMLLFITLTLTGITTFSLFLLSKPVGGPDVVSEPLVGKIPNAELSGS